MPWREFPKVRASPRGRTDKGIILTTGSFTADARKEATRDGVPPIELVDGQKLIDMLAELELGLKSVAAFEVDQTFFDEFRKRFVSNTQFPKLTMLSQAELSGFYENLVSTGGKKAPL